MYDISAPLFWYKATFIVELMISEMLITYTLKKRKFFVLRVIAAALVLFGLSLAMPMIAFNAAYASVIFIILFAASLGALYFCYDEPFFNILFCGILAYTTQHIAYVVCYFFLNVFDISSYAVYGSEPAGAINPLQYVVYFVSYALAYWVVWAFVAHKIRKTDNLKLDNYKLLIFSSTILLIDIVLNLMVVYYAASIINTMLLVIFFVYSVMTCVLAIGMQVFMLRNNDLAHEVATVNRLWHKEKQQYEMKKEKVEMINIKCHDLRHRIRGLRESAIIDPQQLKEIEDTITIYDSFVKTGNEVLDVVLSEESLFCQKNNIKLVCNVDGKQLNFISASDLFSIFDNAIHNAIEAVGRVEDTDKRVVNIRVVRVNDMVSIQIENYCKDADKINFENGLPMTTKDRDNHGFGMRSIQMVVEKLGGGMNVTVSKDRFSLDIAIPVTQEGEE